MNYYRRHIGDYLRDTAHLSLLEHGVYARLLDVYYTREASIPDDQAARLIGARSREEREAVERVLSEFFVRDGASWSQPRCEREIASAREKAERNREVGKKGGRPRKVETHEGRKQEPTENPNGFQSEPAENPSHKPIANSHNSLPPVGSRAREPDPPESLAGKACRLMWDAGVQRVNPSDPRLAALLSQGVTPTQFGDLAAELREAKGEVVGMAYVLATMTGRLREAAAQPDVPPGSAARLGARGTAYGDEIDRIAASIRQGAAPSPETVDVEVRRVG